MANLKGVGGCIWVAFAKTSRSLFSRIIYSRISGYSKSFPGQGVLSHPKNAESNQLIKCLSRRAVSTVCRSGQLRCASRSLKNLRELGSAYVMQLVTLYRPVSYYRAVFRYNGPLELRYLLGLCASPRYQSTLFSKCVPS